MGYGEKERDEMHGEWEKVPRELEVDIWLCFGVDMVWY